MVRHRAAITRSSTFSALFGFVIARASITLVWGSLTPCVSIVDAEQPGIVAVMAGCGGGTSEACKTAALLRRHPLEVME
jgi:hypothetical protein